MAPQRTGQILFLQRSLQSAVVVAVMRLQALVPQVADRVEEPSTLVRGQAEPQGKVIGAVIHGQIMFTLREAVEAVLEPLG
jgi:hypothetical protein